VGSSPRPALAEQVRAELRRAVERLHGSRPWRDALARNGWTDAYQAGDAFGAFIQAENARVGDVLTDLGLPIAASYS
jgi:putative tricarboxylic transport membrane protein